MSASRFSPRAERDFIANRLTELFNQAFGVEKGDEVEAQHNPVILKSHRSNWRVSGRDPPGRDFGQIAQISSGIAAMKRECFTRVCL